MFLLDIFASKLLQFVLSRGLKSYVVGIGILQEWLNKKI
jgi:hypothetical protein